MTSLHSSMASVGDALVSPAVASAPRYSLTSNQLSPFDYPRLSDDQVKTSRIMIVDDEEAVTLALRKYLSEVGFSNFVLVNDGSQAIKQIQHYSPDLVLLDIRMQVNGLDVLQTIRRLDSMKQIPVITLTSDTDSETRTRALNFGADDFLTKPVEVGELVARVRNTISSKICRDELARCSSEMASDSLRDPLTQVANKRAFDFEVGRRMTEWIRQRTPLSLFFVHVDHFSTVVGKHGQQVGDFVLRSVAHEIERTVRATDLVVRYAGDTFAVVLPSCDADEAISTAERVRSIIESSTKQFENPESRMTVSLGVATTIDSDNAESLIHRADAARRDAKQHGGNQCRFHDGQVSLHATASSGMVAGQVTGSRSATASKLLNGAGSSAKILVIDDEPSTVLMVRKLLSQTGYTQIQTLTEPCQAFDLIKSSLPDLVLCDIHMPGVTGLDVLKQVRENVETRHIPVVVLTSSTEAEIKIACLNLGATDFLSKPVNASELIARVRNTLLAKAHLNQLASQSNQLEHAVQRRTAELYASRREAIQCLACAAENRDDQTGHHVFRVGRYAAIIAAELGFSDEHVQWMEHAAQLHDVGKIGIPDSILKKPGRLTDDEFEIMKTHAILGRKIIRFETACDVTGRHDTAIVGSTLAKECSSPIMRMAAVVAETHHEKWDGSGYPFGLRGVEIPIEGRITAVADVFDAIGSVRHYKDALSLDRCFEIITQGSGSHFDPSVVAAFLRRKQDVTSIFLLYNDNGAQRP